MSAFIIGCKVDYPAYFEKRTVLHGGEEYLSGSLRPNITSPYYPKRSDLKIMRTDTISAVITLCELLEQYKIDPSPLDLFVASGVFIENVENHLGHLLKVFETIKNADSEEDKLKKIYRASPPLLALQTLTNSTMSFVAQYSNIKGNNATFGNTSLSGFHAIEEAHDSSFFEDLNAVALSSNTAGDFSYMVNSSMRTNKTNWKESASTAALLFTQDSLNAKCKVTSLSFSSNHKSLSNQHSELHSEITADTDCLIFSGAYTTEENAQLQGQIDQIHKSHFSHFEQFGNMGPTNIFSGIDKGIELIGKGASKIDVLDRDIYGRESLIRLESI